MLCKVLLVKLFCLLIVTNRRTDSSKDAQSERFFDDDEGKEYSDIWAVELEEGADPDIVARDNGFKNKGVIHEKRFYEFVYDGPRKHLAKRASRRHVELIHRRLSDHPHVKWFERQLILQRVKRSLTFNDPKLEYQWYVRNTGKYNSGLKGYDLHIWPVWELGYTGKGVKIAVLDDGLGKVSVKIQLFFFICLFLNWSIARLPKTTTIGNNFTIFNDVFRRINTYTFYREIYLILFLIVETMRITILSLNEDMIFHTFFHTILSC